MRITFYTYKDDPFGNRILSRAKTMICDNAKVIREAERALQNTGAGCPGGFDCTCGAGAMCPGESLDI